MSATESQAAPVTDTVVHELRQRLFGLMGEMNDAKHRAGRAEKAAQQRAEQLEIVTAKVEELTRFCISHAADPDAEARLIAEGLALKTTECHPDDEEEVPVRVPSMRRQA